MPQLSRFELIGETRLFVWVCGGNSSATPIASAGIGSCVALSLVFFVFAITGLFRSGGGPGTPPVVAPYPSRGENCPVIGVAGVLLEPRKFAVECVAASSAVDGWECGGLYVV